MYESMFRHHTDYFITLPYDMWLMLQHMDEVKTNPYYTGALKNTTKIYHCSWRESFHLEINNMIISSCYVSSQSLWLTLPCMACFLLIDLFYIMTVPKDASRGKKACLKFYYTKWYGAPNLRSELITIAVWYLKSEKMFSIDIFTVTNPWATYSDLLYAHKLLIAFLLYTSAHCCYVFIISLSWIACQTLKNSVYY